MNTTTTRKRLNPSILSVKEIGSITGIVGELLSTEEANADGELVKRDFLKFKLDGETEEKLFWFDGGMKGAFKLAKVTPGMHIEIAYESQKKLDNGNNVNVYGIYAVN